MKLKIIIFSTLFTTNLYAQMNKISISVGVNYNYNIGIISNGINSGRYTGWNIDVDDNYNMFKTVDYQFGINYAVNQNAEINLLYRKYNLKQSYRDFNRDMSLKIINPLNSVGISYKRFWCNKKFRPFTSHGLIILFDSKKETTIFTSEYPTSYESSYERTRNFKSYSIINYIFSNSFGINHQVNNRISLDYYFDFNLGIRNLYTNLVVFKITDSTSIGYQGNATGLNKGDKIGFGVKLNYRLKD